MSESLSEQDRSELARAAEHIYRTKQEANQVQRALEQADEETLRTVLHDRSRPTLERQIALGALRKRVPFCRDGTLTSLLLPLLDDPDEGLARMAIEGTPRDDPEVTARLHALLDDPRPGCWSSAASVLATRNDTTIVPRLLGWFREGDQTHRNVAWACLYFYGLLGRDACRDLLRDAWEADDRDDEDRVMLAVGLLGLGDRDGWAFLVDFARRADHYSACWAAETILEHDPALGLDLMLHILAHGTTFQVRWGMVEKIAAAAGLPHVWTVDGLAEARSWVEQQRLDPQGWDGLSSRRRPR